MRAHEDEMSRIMKPRPLMVVSMLLVFVALQLAGTWWAVLLALLSFVPWLMAAHQLIGVRIGNWTWGRPDLVPPK